MLLSVLKGIVAILTIVFLSLPTPWLVSPSVGSATFYPRSPQLSLQHGAGGHKPEGGTPSVVATRLSMAQEVSESQPTVASSPMRATCMIAPKAQRWMEPVIQWVKKMVWMVTRQLQLTTQKRQTVHANVGGRIIPYREEQDIETEVPVAIA